MGKGSMAGKANKGGIRMTEYEIKKLKRETAAEATDRLRKEATQDAFVYLMSLPLIVLHDKYGFGKKRLSDFQDAVLNQYECLGRTVKIEELIKLAEELSGIKFTEDTAERTK